MDICIVSTMHVSYNPRVVKEADALSNAGHTVTVVAVSNNSQQALLDRGVMIDRNWRLLTVSYSKDTLLGRIRSLWFSLRQRLLWKILNPITHHYGFAEHAQAIEFPELRQLACSVKADLYIAHHVEALPATHATAMRHQARFAFDAEDFHSGMFNRPNFTAQEEDLPETVQNLLIATEAMPKNREQQRIEYLENKYLPLCDYITAASDGIAEAYALKYKLPRPTTILNVFPLETLPVHDKAVDEVQDSIHHSPFTIHGLQKDIHHSPFTIHDPQALKSKAENLKPYKLYWYSQVIGPGRGLEDAVRALSLLEKPCELHLRGTPSEPFVTALTGLATKLGVQDRLFFYLPCPPDALISEATRYDIGLALETGKELNNLLAASNKMFSYMNAGLAIVATGTPGQREIMEQVPDAGLLCRMNDADNLSVAIDRLLGDDYLLDLARKASRRAAEERFNWQIEACLFVNLIEKQRKEGNAKM